MVWLELHTLFPGTGAPSLYVGDNFYCECGTYEEALTTLMIPCGTLKVVLRIIV